jgi:RHS repeat-associated protein
MLPEKEVLIPMCISIKTSRWFGIGNVRVSYSRDPQTGLARIVEENNYYPYGLQHSGYNNDVWLNQANTEGQKITFNSREFQNEFDLFVVAMDFRQYDPALGRFTAMDRLTEFAPGITPYRFAFNNPNYWSDPTGLFESRALALQYMKDNNLEGVIQYSNGSFWVVTTVNGRVRSIASIDGEIFDLWGEVLEGTTVSGSSGGGSNNDDGGYWIWSSQLFNFVYIPNESSGYELFFNIGGIYLTTLYHLSIENSKKVYLYGTKSMHRDVLTSLNNRRMLGIASKAKIGGHVISFVQIFHGVYLDGGNYGYNAKIATGSAIGGTLGAWGTAKAFGAFGFMVAGPPGMFFGGLAGALIGGWAGSTIGENVVKNNL